MTMVKAEKHFVRKISAMNNLVSKVQILFTCKIN